MVQFGENLIIVNKSWTDFKSIVTAKTMLMQYEYEPVFDGYQIFAVDDSIVYLCQLFLSKLPIDIDANTNSSALTDFTTNYMASANLPLVPRLPDGRPRLSAEKTAASRVTFYSPNWCDKTTWYPSSVYVQNETPSLAGDGYYHLANPFVIDSYHGNITQEDFLKDANGNSYRVSVTCDGYTKVEQDPHYGTGGDFIVNYRDGYIIPLTSWNPQTNTSVQVSYHYATTANFTVKPSAGKQLLINLAECQFSTDVQMLDTVTFQVWGYAGVFAPQLNYPFTTLIPLTTFKYKAMSDLFNDSMRSYPVYPAIGGNSWRGLGQPTTVLDWDYVSQTALSSASGMQVVISLDHNTEFGGEYATVTFYCTSE